MIPSLFISHGAPDRVIHQSPAKNFLLTLTNVIKKPKAIIIFSAHWFSKELQLTSVNAHETYHDITGFSPELYKVKYSAEQPAWLFNTVVQHLNSHNISYQESKRGLDHGAWSVLSLAYPKGDIPVIAMSLPIYDNIADYFELGKSLKALRKDDILIIGSGSATHNLSALNHDKTPPSWATSFITWLQEQVATNNYAALTNIYQANKWSRMAHPSFDHYVPLLIAAGAAEGESNELIHDSYELGSLNNSCFKFG